LKGLSIDVDRHSWKLKCSKYGLQKLRVKLSSVLEKKVTLSRLPANGRSKTTLARDIKTSSTRGPNKYPHWALRSTSRGKSVDGNIDALHDFEVLQDLQMKETRNREIVPGDSKCDNIYLGYFTRECKIDQESSKHVKVMQSYHFKGPLNSKKAISHEIIRTNKDTILHHEHQEHNGTDKVIWKTRERIIRREIAHIRHSSSHPVPIS
jgi:hypothetical protein